MNFQEFKKKFPSEPKIIAYFVKVRYKNGLVCNHCGGSEEQIYQRIDLPKNFECKNCNNSFSIFKNTIFENSSTDLKKWFYAIHLFLNDKKGISALQLQREIGTTYKTSWRMLRQIRLAMDNKKKKGDKKDVYDNDDFIKTVIEILS
jgi:transposase-like protein